VKEDSTVSLLSGDMRRVVDEQRLGFVATVCPDGTANLSPKGTVAVWDDEHLVFLDFRSPGTIANLKSNPSVEVNVVDPIRRKGYRFKGEGLVLTEGKLFDRVLDLFERDRGVRRDRARAAVLIRVETAAPLISPIYDLGASEKEVSASWLDHHLALHGGAGTGRPAE
jgi:uncharacterized protein